MEFNGSEGAKGPDMDLINPLSPLTTEEMEVVIPEEAAASLLADALETAPEA
ncbi:unnamed protein product, partial [Allacma fusca]